MKKPPQPYWSHALTRFPKDQKLLDAIAGYLDMRIQKKGELSINEWDACLDQVLDAYEVNVPATSKVRRISAKPTITIPELTYLFLTATARKWNHIIFTTKEDRMYANMSYYQDPYWNETKNNPETLAILKEELAWHK